MDLLRRFTLADIDAFETSVRQIQASICGWIIRIVRDPGVAEDLTVESLWRMYRSRHKFRVDGNLEAWAYRIATNLAIDYLRGRNLNTACWQNLSLRPTRTIFSRAKYEKKSKRLSEGYRPSCKSRPRSL